MNDAPRPIYCLADSQLLFWRDDDDALWLERLVKSIESPASARSARAGKPNGRPLRAAYVGASNGDEPAFYSIFAAAVEAAGIGEHRMVRSSFGDEDRVWLVDSDLVLLAGGDPVRGWRIIEQSGMREAINARHSAGATLIGISAGAMQLGWMSVSEAPSGFRLVPAVIGAHDEENDWRELRRLLADSDLAVRGLGIPSGGGLVYHPDGAVEPVRHAVHELVRVEGTVRHSLLFPGEVEPADPVSSSGAH